MQPAVEATDSLRERIRQRQPRDLGWSAYVSGWVQAAIQLAVFAGSLWLLQGETRPVPVLLLCLAFGWAWFCLLMVGHDAMHQAFVSSRRLNQVVAFLALDCLLFSRASWLQGHNVIHHGRPFSKEDRMYLRGDSVLADMWNLLVMVLTYLAWDVRRLVTRPAWHEWLGMAVRLTLFWALLPVVLLPAILFLLLCGNYLGLLSHALPVGRGTADPVLRQLRATWDLYPGSFVMSLLTGGLNAHATHHVYPTLPRGAQARGMQILRELAGAEYRRVETLAGLWTLFRLRRFCTTQVASIESIASGAVPGGLSPLSDDWAAVIGFPGEGVRVPSAGSAGPLERRTAERRREQLPISFPDRRKGDRRAARALATA